jgi:hypothetical protein
LKKTFFFFALSIFTSVFLFAHNPSIGLNAGEMYCGLNVPPTGGASYITLYTMDESQRLRSVMLLSATNQFNVSYGGDLESFEYGFNRFFSAGARLGLIDCLGGALFEKTFRLSASIFGRANIVNRQFIKSNVTSEMWFSPLFSVPKAEWMGAGLIHSLNTIDFSVPIFQEKKSMSLFAYADIKHIASFVNMAAIPEALSADMVVDLSSEETSQISVDYGVMNRFALALGLDFTWKDFTVCLGWNMRLFDFIIDPQYKYRQSYLTGFQFLTTADICNLELSWQYRIRPRKTPKSAITTPEEEIPPEGNAELPPEPSQQDSPL